MAPRNPWQMYGSDQFGPTTLDPNAAQSGNLSFSQDAANTPSSAVGASAPGVVPNKGSMPGDRGPGSSQMNPSGAPTGNPVGVSNGGNWWSNTAGNEFGPTEMIANPASFWQSYAMHQLGLGMNSNTGNWLAGLVQDPVGLARATGALGGGVAGNDQELSAMNQIGGLLGKNASFDPASLVRNTLQQLVNFNPNQKGGATQGNALALQLYSDNPITMAGNIMTFLKGVLGGIIPQDTFNQIGTAMSLAANTISGKAINTPGTTLVSDRPGQGVAQQMMGILHQFGVI